MFTHISLTLAATKPKSVCISRLPVENQGFNEYKESVGNIPICFTFQPQSVGFAENQRSKSGKTPSIQEFCCRRGIFKGG